MKEKFEFVHSTIEKMCIRFGQWVKEKKKGESGLLQWDRSYDIFVLVQFAISYKMNSKWQFRSGGMDIGDA